MIKTFIKTHIIDYAVKLVLDNIERQFNTIDLTVSYIIINSEMYLIIPHMNKALTISELLGYIDINNKHYGALNSLIKMNRSSGKVIDVAIPLEMAQNLNKIIVYVVNYANLRSTYSTKYDLITYAESDLIIDGDVALI
jgi:hypothetical protein